MKSKKEIAEQILCILKPIGCEECPLNDTCDLVDSESNKGSICSILKEEKENVDNE